MSPYCSRAPQNKTVCIKRCKMTDRGNFQFPSRDFGQVTCSTFPPSKVTQRETGGPPEMCVCSSTRTVSGKEANTTDACGFPPGPQTLTSLSPKCKHKTKCLAQNKQCRTCWGEFRQWRRFSGAGVCKLQNHMWDWDMTTDRSPGFNEQG